MFLWIYFIITAQFTAKITRHVLSISRFKLQIPYICHSLTEKWNSYQ